MSQTQGTLRRPTPSPQAADLRSTTEALLRDVAYVLHLTRTVKQSLTRPTMCRPADDAALCAASC
jgi:hypothetical protein